MKPSVFDDVRQFSTDCSIIIIYSSIRVKTLAYASIVHINLGEVAS